MALADILVPKLRSNGDGAPPFIEGTGRFVLFTAGMSLLVQTVSLASLNHDLLQWHTIPRNYPALNAKNMKGLCAVAHEDLLL